MTTTQTRGTCPFCEKDSVIVRGSIADHGCAGSGCAPVEVSPSGLVAAVNAYAEALASARKDAAEATDKRAAHRASQLAGVLDRNLRCRADALASWIPGTLREVDVY